MANSKFPKKYTEANVGSIRDPFIPEFRYDSRGRLIMPLPGYSKMMLSTEPGSKDIKQGTVNESEGPLDNPSTLGSGYLALSTAIKIGPKGSWVVQLAGGNYSHPISYFNETSNEEKFYVDKNGNVYLKGVIVAETGGQIGGWTIGTNELYAGSGTSRVGLRPGTWPFYAGNEDPTQALARINSAGQAWFTSVQVISGPDIGNLAHLNVVSANEIANAAVTFEKVEKWFAGKMGTSFPSSPSNGEEFLRTDENRFYRYSSSQAKWIPVDYHPDSERFADNAIKNAKIESLDAGKITTGYLAAARLNTSVAYITQSAMIANAVIVDAHIHDLSANKINAGELTGIVIKSANSGQRVIIYSSYMQFDSPSYANVGWIYADNSGLWLKSNYSGSYIYIDGQSGIGFFVNGTQVMALYSTYLNANYKKISNLSDPTSSQDAATKYYVDTHAGASSLSQLTIDTTKNWCGYGIFNIGNISSTGTVQCSLLNVNCSSPYNRIAGDLTVTGDFYPEGVIRTPLSTGNIRDVIPIVDCVYDCGYGTGPLKFYRGYFYFLPSCPLPTGNSAINIFKKIRDPIKMKANHGERLYFPNDYFPKEMQILPEDAIAKGRTPDPEPTIDLVRTIGVSVQAIRELIKRIEAIETKIGI